jgi:hypothetical protein
MITKEELLSPPSDIVRLENLEHDLTGRAEMLITSLLKSPKLKISQIHFEYTLANIAADAQILETGRYRIRVGRLLSNALLHFATWSAPRLRDKLNLTQNLTELEEFLYEYWMWVTFHHELNHTTSGHLDFLQSHGLIRYAEIYGSGESPDPLVVAGVTQQDAWWAIESEADAYATATSLGSLPLLKHSGLLQKQTTLQTISMHGMLVSMYFLLFDRLKSSNDTRHPAPAFRKAVCQPSLDKLCKQMHLDVRLVTEEMIMADFALISDVLKLQIDVQPYFAAGHWMFKMDSLLEKMGMRQFRKQ